MMPDSQNERLLKRAYWVSRLRWIAALVVCAATYCSANFFGISLNIFPLYAISVLLVVYNALLISFLKYFTRGEFPHYGAVKKIVEFQISADLVILTFVLHYSGGIENPFVFYFIFHMIIASILLSVMESFLQATFACLLFGLMLLLEYEQIISHYCLKGFVSNCLYRDTSYIVGTYFTFVTAIYLVVYMASSIATKMRNAEEAYREANEQLRQKDRIKDEYVLRVTHDIKGHLAAIKSCLDVVVRKLVGDLNPEQLDLLETSARRAGSLNTFIKALLNLTSMKLQGKMEMSNFSLLDAIDGAFSTVESGALGKSLSLVKKIDVATDEIFGNQVSIEEAITDLLLNAIKYTPEKGTVTLRAEDECTFVRIEVEDTGIGIPQNEQPRIFEEFFRASNAKNIERDGTGLGLSIVKQIVENHKGRVGFESKENVGTRIWFELPKRSLSIEM
jgi:signal transduction histidine kinase